jgi:hypothetical protein
MRLSSTFTVLSLPLALSLVACGDDGGSNPAPDADSTPNIGFNKPDKPLMANARQNGNWVELGPANLTCLNTPSDDEETTTAITITAEVTDFEKGLPVPGAVVTLFKDQAIDSPEGEPATANDDSKVTLTVPAGTKRFGYKMTHSTALDTLLLNQVLRDPSTTPQEVGEIQIVKTTTAQTLSALINVSRTPGTGILAGAMRDCDGNEVSNFIATVSRTSGMPDHVPGVDNYYFSPSVGLPARHNQQPASSANGLFMSIEMQPTAKAYVQVWGYPTQADVDNDNLTLIAELETQVIADTVITGSYEPLRTSN